MDVIKCCRYCTVRTLGCHSVCIDYIMEKEKNDELNEKRLRHTAINRWTDRYRHSKIEILNRKKRGFRY